MHQLHQLDEPSIDSVGIVRNLAWHLLLLLYNIRDRLQSQWKFSVSGEGDRLKLFKVRAESIMARLADISELESVLLEIV